MFDIQTALALSERFDSSEVSAPGTGALRQVHGQGETLAALRYCHAFEHGDA